MSKFKSNSIILSILLVTMGLGLSPKKDEINLSALSPMPTSINTSSLDRVGKETYYQSVEDKKGDDLLAALYQVIKDHNEYDYDNNTHRFIYKIIDRNWQLSPLTSQELQNFDYTNDNPYIRKLYADYNDDIARADRFKNDGASRVSFDKEHIWAQSLGGFGRDGGAGSDFHSLLPSDVRGNQHAHSNYNFAPPTSGISEYNNDKGTYVGRNGYIAGSDQKVFEPLDQYKGDVARAMFYMVARYYEYIDVLHPKLSLVDGSPAAMVASSQLPGLAGDLETLLAWHQLDPVDSYEIKRNNLIYFNYQENRNPFIDYPEWAEIALSTSYSGDGVSFDNSPPTSEEPQTPVKTLSRIDVTIIENQNFLFLTALDHASFVVEAIYSDNTRVTISNFSLALEDSTQLLLTKLGSNNVVITYSEGGITRSVTLEIDVILTTTHYLVGGGIAIILLVGLISFSLVYQRNKKLRKSGKKLINHIKKTSKKIKK